MEDEYGYIKPADKAINEAEDKICQRGYFLQLAGRLLGREMIILGLRFGDDCFTTSCMAPGYLSS